MPLHSKVFLAEGRGDTNTVIFATLYRERETAMNTILYEFTYVDNKGISESERLAEVKEQLDEEAFFQGWNPGYRIKEVRTHVEADFIRYYYQVVGTFNYWEYKKESLS